MLSGDYYSSVSGMSQGLHSVFTCNFLRRISACKFMHAYFSYDLSPNYARLNVTAVNNGGLLLERLTLNLNAII